jgi:hypothetical protein
MPFVASTLSNDQIYTAWQKPISEGGKIARPAVPLRQVYIKGKANVANKITTPEGVITSITEEEAEFLKNNAAFKAHESRGHVKIIARSADPEKVAKDMTARDESAPLSVEKGDFEPGGRAAGGPAPGTPKII